jgi:WD40 repeat protein
MRKEKLITFCAFLMIVLSIFPLSSVYGQTFSVEPVAHLKTGDFGFNCPIDISNDGSTLAVAMKDESSNVYISIINMSRFEILGSLEIDVSFNYLGGTSLSLNPNGTKLAVVAFNYFRIFTAPDLELEKALENSTEWPGISPEDVSWSPDGKLLAIFLDEFNQYIPLITIFNTTNWTKVIELNISSPEIVSIAWSRDGTMLTCAGDGTISGERILDVWNTSNWTKITTQSIDIRFVNDLAFNPNGSMLVAAGLEGPIQVWNTIDWSQRSFGGAHSNVTRSVSFSRDGELLMTDSVLWTIDDLEQWGEFNLATHGLFSPSHDEVVTVTFDGDLYKWDSTGWSAAAARGDKPNFKEPKSTITFTLCTTLIVIAIAILIIVVILVIITVLIIKKKSKRENTF